MENVLGPQLQTHSGLVPTSTLNNAKYVLFYFSAHWCPPCKGFTPKLALFYDSVNSTEKQLEIVYVSADRSPEQFNEYFDEMPWIAVPYAESQKRGELAQTFRIQGIPALFLVGPGGNMVRDTCRMDVTNKGPLCLSDWDNALGRQLINIE